MADNRVKLAQYVAETEQKASVQLLIKPETGELWEVDTGELRNRGVPTGWELYDSVSKETLLFYLQDCNGTTTF